MIKLAVVVGNVRTERDTLAVIRDFGGIVMPSA